MKKFGRALDRLVPFGEVGRASSRTPSAANGRVETGMQLSCNIWRGRVMSKIVQGSH